MGWGKGGCEEEPAFELQMGRGRAVSWVFSHGNKSDHTWKVTDSWERETHRETPLIPISREVYVGAW